MDKHFTKTSPRNLPRAEVPAPADPEEAYFPPQQPPMDPHSIDADLEEFQQIFPEVYALARVNSQCIPAQVWELVRTGMTLTEAFRSWLDRQQPLNLNQRNARRRTGSMRSAGRDTAVSDPFLRGFYAND